MGVYLPPGSCDKELKALEDAERELRRAWNAYQSADNNLVAGEWATGAGVGGIFGCAILGLTGIGAVVCLAAAGAGTIGGTYWTVSAGQGMLNPMEDLEDAMRNSEAAIAAACKCYESHAVCEPD